VKKHAQQNGFGLTFFFHVTLEEKGTEEPNKYDLTAAPSFSLPCEL
jgi:hypothetical protein